MGLKTRLRDAVKANITDPNSWMDALVFAMTMAETSGRANKKELVLTQFVAAYHELFPDHDVDTVRLVADKAIDVIVGASKGLYALNRKHSLLKRLKGRCC